MTHFFKLIFLLLITMSVAEAQPKQQDINHEKPFSLTYKNMDDVKLDMTLIYPDKFKKRKRYPCMVFFFGGGWNGGTIEQFRPQAEYFAARGMITVLADYRVKSRHKTTPYESVEDAKSAVRYLRKYAEILNIDPSKIVASGGSAGGHIAAATGVCPTLDNPNESTAISSRADALVLFNPVFDNGPSGFCHERMGQRWKEISPAHNITDQAPPTIVFLGKEDHLIPVSVAQNYKNCMQAVNRRCDLFLYDGAGHGFFNKNKYEGRFYKETITATDNFLKSLGYIR
ncbi:alpha/beta hydrolase [Persicobacter psychrovividus]|uniref:Lipase n=1 Tax=Persicobacter psychrovividus TaxID=387638 RepID=A0ABN6LJ86_9BACT|nr:lipase [Persicobacter psychrovividus]